MDAGATRSRPDARRAGRLTAWAAGGALAAGAFALYFATLSPGALGGDPGELQFVPHILGMTHPTGMPLYVLLGKAWSSLPFGPGVAWRMNLLAAASASLAVATVYAIAHLLTGRLVPALGAALALAFGSTFWKLATVADKYAFNALMLALVLYLALRWGKSRSPVLLNLLAITYGLSLTHHRTMLLVAPPLLAYVWWRERGALWRDGRRLLRLAVLLLAPLLLYLYVPWAEARNLPPGTWHPGTIPEWIAYFFPPGQAEHVSIEGTGMVDRLLSYGRTLGQDVTWVGLLLGLVGLAWQLGRRTADGLLLLAIFTLQAFLSANHDMHHRWMYFLPSFLVFALWIGEGLDMIAHAFERFIPGPSRLGQGLGLAFSVGLLAVLLLPVPQRARPLREAHLGAGTLDIWRQALREGFMADRLGAAIAQVDPAAVVVADWEQATPLWYYQQVEGWNPGVQIVYPSTRLDEAAAMGQPLYIARTWEGLADRWHPSAVGPLIALNPEPQREIPAGVTPLSLRMGDTFELAGFSYGQADFRPGTVVPLTLYWRAIRPPPADYSVSLRLYDANGNELAKIDSQNPVLGTYPTSRWSAGEVVADYCEIQLPFGLSPGMVHWGVLLYRALPDGGWENLKVGGTEAEVATGGAFQVRQRP